MASRNIPNKEKVLSLLDECIAYVDSKNDGSSSSNKMNLDTGGKHVSTLSTASISSLNVSTAHSRNSSIATPSVGLRSTAPEPPSPSAYTFPPSASASASTGKDELTGKFPAEFPVSPSNNNKNNNKNNKTNDNNTNKNEKGSRARESDNDNDNDDEEDLDSDVENGDGDGEKGEKKLTATEKLIIEENGRESFLIPKYYTLCIESRPFGIALCKKFDENYLCVALPESPSGQLGLRNGSQILGIDQFIIDSNNYVLCNKKFPNYAHSWFYMMGFDKINWLTTHLPINFFLKFDPLQILSEGTKKDNIQKRKDELNERKEEECDFWRQMQDDIYRWAIDKKAEYWKIIDGNFHTTGGPKTLDIMSMTPIESKGVQKRLEERYKYLKEKDMNKRRPDWEKRNGKPETEPKSAFSSDVLDQDIVQFDDEYKRVGTLKVGDIVGVYAKAGAWLEIREPVAGWIKFYDASSDTTFARKCDKNDDVSQVKAKANTNATADGAANIVRDANDGPLFTKITPHDNCDPASIIGGGTDYLTNSKGDFGVHIQTMYIKHFETAQGTLLEAATSVEKRRKEQHAKNSANSDGNSDEKEDSKQNESKDNNNKNDKNTEKAIDECYWLSDVILNKSEQNTKSYGKQAVIYFMGDLDFGSTLKTIDSHLHALQKLQRKYGNNGINWIVIKVCSINSTHSDYAKKSITYKTEDNINHNLSGFIVGRVTTNVLKLYGLNRYEAGFFKFGLLMTNPNGEILIQPSQPVDTAIEQIEQNIQV